MTNLEFCKYVSTLPKLTDDQRTELDVIKSGIKTARDESTKAERKAMHKYFDFVYGLHPDTVMITGSMYNGKPYVTKAIDVMIRAIEWNCTKLESKESKEGEE